MFLKNKKKLKEDKSQNIHVVNGWNVGFKTANTMVLKI